MIKLSFDHFVYLLLSVCFLTNFFYINKEYFDRATQIEVQIETDNMMIYPPIQICLPYNMSNYQTLHRYKPDMYPMDANLSKNQIEKEIKKLPVWAINEYGALQHDVQIECLVYYTENQRFKNLSHEFDRSLASEVACDRFFPIKETIMYYHTLDLYKCYIYMAMNSDEVNAFYKEKDIPTTSLYKFTFNYSSELKAKNTFPGIQLTFFAEIMFPIGLYFQLFTLPLIDILSIELSYSTVTEKLLPPPYNTRCRTYEEYGRAGRMGCYQNCVYDKVKKANFSLPMFYGVDLNFTKPIIDKKLISKNFGVPFAIKFRKLCLAACSQRQCTETRFEVSVETIYQTNRENKNGTMELYVTRPATQHKIYRHSPRTSLAGYVSLSGGALSLWFGFSAIHLYFVLKKSFLSKIMPNRKPVSISFTFVKSNKINVKKFDPRMTGRQRWLS